MSNATRAIDVHDLNRVFNKALDTKWNHEAIRGYAKEKFNISVMANNYLNLYKEVMEGKWWG